MPAFGRDQQQQGGDRCGDADGSHAGRGADVRQQHGGRGQRGTDQVQAGGAHDRRARFAVAAYTVRARSLQGGG